MTIKLVICDKCGKFTYVKVVDGNKNYCLDCAIKIYGDSKDD